MNYGRTIDQALDRFQATRQGARRHHKDTIGNVDPERCFAAFLAAVRTGNEKALAKFYPGGAVQKAALGDYSGTLGGYTIPVEFSEALVENLSTDGLFRRY